jgi:hypothetical protein
MLPIVVGFDFKIQNFFTNFADSRILPGTGIPAPENTHTGFQIFSEHDLIYDEYEEEDGANSYDSCRLCCNLYRFFCHY